MLTPLLLLALIVCLNAKPSRFHFMQGALYTFRKACYIGFWILHIRSHLLWTQRCFLLASDLLQPLVSFVVWILRAALGIMSVHTVLHRIKGACRRSSDALFTTCTFTALASCNMLWAHRIRLIYFKASISFCNTLEYNVEFATNVTHLAS